MNAMARVLVDYYVLATAMLLVVEISLWLIRQPARRMTLAWGATAGLGVLAATCFLPGWPRFPVASGWRAAADATGPVAITTPIEEPQASFGMSELPAKPERASVPRTGSDSVSVGGDERAPAAQSNARPTDAGPAELDPLRNASSARVVPPLASRHRIGWTGLLLAPFALCGASILVWLVVGVYRVRSLCARAVPAPEELLLEMKRVSGTRKSPRLLVCREVNVAAACGLVRPTILLPASATQLGHKTIRAVLAHEWSHIRNGDLWLLSAQRVLLLILFAHPLFWLLRKRVRKNQEYLADAWAASSLGRRAYLEGLLVWARECLASRSLSPAVGIWERQSPLKARVTILLDDSRNVQLTSPQLWRCAACTALAILVLGLSPLAFLRPTARATSVESASVGRTETPTIPWVIETEYSDAVADITDLGLRLIRRRDGTVNVNFSRPPTAASIQLLSSLPSIQFLSLEGSGAKGPDVALLEKLPSVESLRLNGAQFAEGGFDQFKRLDRIKGLSLQGMTVDDSALARLQEAPRLTSLSLFSTSITRRGFQFIRKLPKLEELKVLGLEWERQHPDDPQVTDEEMAHLKDMPNLKSLTLGFGTRVSDKGLEYLANVDRLESLDIWTDLITDAGFAHLGQLTNLKSVSISVREYFGPPTPSAPGSLRSRQAQVTDAAIGHLRPLKNLRELKLDGGSFTDDGISDLVELKQLRSLSLQRVQNSDKGLEHLGKLTELETVRFVGWRSVTDAGLQHLRQLTRMQTLSLTGAEVTDKGLAVLRHMKDLYVLHLGGSGITDVGLANLEGLEHLHFLSMHETAVHGEGLRHLVKLPQLRSINLDGTPITDAALEHLSSLRTLTSLGLTGTKITGAGFVHLRSLPNLHTFRLSGSDLDDNGLAHLAVHSALTRLELDATKITDDGLGHLAGLRDLRWLGLNGTRVTQARIDELRKSLPHAKIQFAPKTEVDPGDRYRRVPFVERQHQQNPLQFPRDDADIEKMDPYDVEDRITLATGHRITDKGLAAMQRLPVRSIHIMHFGAVTATGIASLTENPHVKWMSMDNPRSEHLAALSKAKAIENVSISDRGGLTLEQISQLGAMRKLRNLSIMGVRIPPDDLHHFLAFRECKQLGSLSLHNSGVDEAGRARITEMLPSVGNLTVFGLPRQTLPNAEKPPRSFPTRKP